MFLVASHENLCHFLFFSIRIKTVNRKSFWVRPKKSVEYWREGTIPTTYSIVPVPYHPVHGFYNLKKIFKKVLNFSSRFGSVIRSVDIIMTLPYRSTKRVLIRNTVFVQRLTLNLISISPVHLACWKCAGEEKWKSFGRFLARTAYTSRPIVQLLQFEPWTINESKREYCKYLLARKWDSKLFTSAPDLGGKVVLPQHIYHKRTDPPRSAFWRQSKSSSLQRIENITTR